MIIYKDIFSGDEMVSDAYDMTLVDDVIYEVDCTMIKVKKGADVDIGANASAEEPGDDDVEDGVETVNNVVFSFRLSPSSFDKKSYLGYLKKYMKDVKNKLTESGASPEEITKFEKGAQTAAKKIAGGFKDYEFFVGESMDVNGMVPLLNYREDGVTPYIIFWKHGLKEEKV